MKTYTTDTQIRLVGKAWEIRRYLKMALQRTDRSLLLSDYLKDLSSSAPKAFKPVIDPKVVLLQPRPVFDLAGSEFRSSRKTPASRTTETARVIPFPVRY
jgi:hypothetical protein